jgi:hypothetical protein
VGEQVFKANASEFVSEHLNFENSNVAQVNIDPKTHIIKVFLIGEHIAQSKLDTISLQLNKAGLKEATLKVYQNGENEVINSSVLKAGIVADLYTKCSSVIR